MDIIKFCLENIGLVLLILAIIIIAIDYSRHKNRLFFEIAFRWFALLPLGLTAIYAFVMHAFFPEFTAAQIGWSNSPFQFEVAMANLGFGLIGVFSFRASFGFRLATVIGNTAWLWGDAIGHIYQMLHAQNFSVGNAGSWFWLDIFIPLLLIICLSRLPRR